VVSEISHGIALGLEKFTDEACTQRGALVSSLGHGDAEGFRDGHRVEEQQMKAEDRE